MHVPLSERECDQITHVPDIIIIRLLNVMLYTRSDDYCIEDVLVMPTLGNLVPGSPHGSQEAPNPAHFLPGASMRHPISHIFAGELS